MSAFIIALAKILASALSAGLLYQGFSPSRHGVILTKIAGVIVSVCTIVAVIPDVRDFFTTAEASQTEQKFWEGVLKYREEHKNNQMDCEYVKKYPDGQFIVLAKAECPDKVVEVMPALAVDVVAPSAAMDATVPAEETTPTPVAAETRQDFEPEMVKLPSGLWMGKYEVTIGEYMQCVNDGGCRNPEWLETGSEYNINTGSSIAVSNNKDMLDNIK